MTRARLFVWLAAAAGSAAGCSRGGLWQRTDHILVPEDDSGTESGDTTTAVGDNGCGGDCSVGPPSCAQRGGTACCTGWATCPGTDLGDSSDCGGVCCSASCEALPPPFEPGYSARPCGFDMNRDGVAGGATDCDLCDGFTTDPDGDAEPEDLIYVHAAAGSDSPTCGTATSPCSTLGYVLANRVDGPGDGQEDVLCLAGVFNEGVQLSEGGVAGHYLRDGFELPSNPLMIVGWDEDDDGEYPPYDPDDTAVLDGEDTIAEAIWVQSSASHVEVAHLEIVNHRISLLEIDSGSPHSHLYLHDVEASNLLRGDSAPVIDVVVPVSYLAIANTAILDVNLGDPLIYVENGSHVRLEGITSRLADDPGGPGETYHVQVRESSHVDILDSFFDANPDAWTVPATEAFGIWVGNCSRNVLVRGNLLADFSNPIYVAPGTTCRASRTLSNIIIDGNLLRNDYPSFTVNAPLAVIVEQAPRVEITTETVAVINNYILSMDCFFSEAGNPTGAQPGTVTFSGNTCYRAASSRAAIEIASSQAHKQEHYVVNNNIVANQETNALNIRVDYAVALWEADGNVYDGASDYEWNLQTHDNLAAWIAASGGDNGSTECSPAFRDPATMDLHLRDDDSCARDRGVDITMITERDFDGDPRPPVGSDAGADEVM